MKAGQVVETLNISRSTLYNERLSSNSVYMRLRL